MHFLKPLKHIFTFLQDISDCKLKKKTQHQFTPRSHLQSCLWSTKIRQWKHSARKYDCSLTKELFLISMVQLNSLFFYYYYFFDCYCVWSTWRIQAISSGSSISGSTLAMIWILCPVSHTAALPQCSCSVPAA